MSAFLYLLTGSVAATAQAVVDDTVHVSEAPPEVARAMLDAAAATGEMSQISAVANAARSVFPEHIEAIDSYAEGLTVRLLIGATSDLVMVKAKPAKEPPRVEVDDSVDAEELQPAEPPTWLKLGDWDGKATASGIVATGNSDTAAAGLHIDARREFSYFTHNISLYFDYGTSKGVKSQQRWGAAYKLDYLLGDNTYAYGRVSYDEDEFSGFDYKVFGGLGIGHNFYDTKTFKLKVEGGPGYQYSPIDNSREIDNRAAFYASGELHWIIRPGLKFQQNLNATWTSPTSTLISNSAITTALTDTLSTGISFLYRYETDPPA
ncbi:MAG: DUF481 domain-containing protein, partial [Amphiplicatus sp.]